MGEMDEGEQIPSYNMMNSGDVMYSMVTIVS